MWNRLTGGAKFLIVLLLVGGIVAGIRFGMPNLFKNDKSSTTSTKKFFGGNDDADITIGVNTWAPYGALVRMNGGLEPNENSRMFKEYGIKLRIKINDVFEDSRNNFKSGSYDLVYCTADVLPIEMGAGSGMTTSNSRVVLLVDWSRGGDAAVGRKGINSIKDAKNKTVAFAEGTASHSLLIKTLETNDLTMNDIQPKKVADGIEAAKLFKAGVVDIAVVWAPDDLDCVAAVPGSKVLTSTRVATHIIADCILAKEEFINSNKDLMVRFATAWLVSNGEINSVGVSKDFENKLQSIIESNSTDIEKNKQIDNLIATYRTNPLVDAADAFAKAFNTDFQFAYNGIKNARLTTLGDNRDFFGLNSLYQGITGEQLYSKMSIVYGQIGLAKNPVAWRNISNTSIVEAMNITSNQESEGSVKFTAVTQEIKQKEAMSNKTITINFDNNSSTLSDDAMATIDREFVNIAKTFTKARIRIEGNTDAVGNASYNKSLSQKRAQAVANYLIKEYGFDPNRFIVVGNGMNKAIADGVSGSNEFYRRTDFQLIED